MSAPAVEVVEQAIAWRVRLASGAASADEWQGCTAWRGLDPQHELAWQRLEALGQCFAVVPPQLGRITLAQPAIDAQRRRALKQLAVLGTAVAAGVLGQQWQPWQPLLAQYRTATGERRQVRLADGSVLHLNSATAVDIDYSAERRLLHLYRGEVLISSTADRIERPLLVSTAQGLLCAQQARFLLREQADGCQLTVYAGAVEVRPRAALKQAVTAGQQVQFDAGGVSAPVVADDNRSSWVDGVLVARQMRLGQFVAELGRQRPGVLRCDPAISELQISGVFPLDDTDRALAALSRTLPVQVLYRSRYWVSVLPA